MKKCQKVKNDIVPIYENEEKEKLINARELHCVLQNKRQFADWIKQRIKKYEFIENTDFVKHHNFVIVGNLKRPQIDYYLSIDMAKELCMIENNQIGRKIRLYFIETEKHYKQFIEKPSNIFDFMRLALNQIETNENRLTKIENEVDNIKSKVDVVIKNNYCFASDIAQQLGIFSERNLPHSNFIAAIARTL